MRHRATLALRSLLERFSADVDANAVAELWDGSRVRLGSSVDERTALTIRFREPGALSVLARRPSLATLFEIVARGWIEIDGMSPLDATRSWDHLRVVKFARRLGVAGFAKALWPFLFLPRPSGNGSGLSFDGKSGAAEIRHHYDVSNEFYRLFLDERMVYSCGYFERDDAGLDDAQHAKLDISCRKLRLREGARMLDIGCGWGGMAIHAAESYGARVTGITLSEEQFALATERVRERVLQDRIEIRLADWREIVGEAPFDAVVQIGMYEHVAQADQAPFFAAVKGLLAADGTYLHHAIVRRHRGPIAKRSPYMDVIDRFIFPGGELDHIGRSLQLAEHAGLEPHDTENWRFHYARTCRIWSERLWERRKEAEAIAGADVTRMWLLYLAMVTVGFERAITGIHQTVFTHRRKGPPPVPLTRAHLYDT